MEKIKNPESLTIEIPNQAGRSRRKLTVGVYYLKFESLNFK